MKIYPAIDIIDKKAVRLLKGDYGKKTVYEKAPRCIAKEFYECGARHLHLVDLDGAKSGGTDNFSVIREITRSVDMLIEVGGGIRTMDRIERYLDAGAGRVILGTAAIDDPDFLLKALEKYPDKIAVGVDAKDGFVATHGWLKVSSVDSFEFCRKMQSVGVRHIIYTDISKDGTESGTNLEAYERLSSIDGVRITASGGITYYGEIERLCSLGIYGAILGKALYSGKIELSRAIEIAEGHNAC